MTCIINHWLVVTLHINMSKKSLCKFLNNKQTKNNDISNNQNEH